MLAISLSDQIELWCESTYHWPRGDVDVAHQYRTWGKREHTNLRAANRSLTIPCVPMFYACGMRTPWFLDDLRTFNVNRFGLFPWTDECKLAQFGTSEWFLPLNPAP